MIIKCNRPIAALVVTALVLTACSSDGDDAVDPTPPPAPETTEADAAPGTTDDTGLTGDGLDVGFLAPAPGLLATLIRGQQRGVTLAADDIAGGGGVLDGPLSVSTFVAEPGGEPTDNADAALADGVAALIGPAGSDPAIAVRDVVAASGAIACSPSASLPRVTADQDPIALMRTVLPDDIVALYLSNVVQERRDAAAPAEPWTVAIVSRSDDYGRSISSALAAMLQTVDIQPVVVGYHPRRVEFSATAREVAAVGADLTVLVTYEEGANLLASLLGAGLDPATMIGLDAFFAPRIASQATPGSDSAAADGFTLVGSMGNKAFLDRLYDDDSNGEVAFAPQAYDCAVVLALAATAVDLGVAASMADAVVDVTGGGTTCTTYDDCLDKLTSGEDIDYDGVSGRLEIDERGDPTWARFTTATLQGGAIANISSSDVDIAATRRQLEAYFAAAHITQVQRALQFLGFYDGPINGLDTAEFRAGLAAFQASVGLPPTGTIDEATDAALREALGPYADVLAATTMDIQRQLAELGFYDGPIDGVWSAAVTDAIRALQRELGVPETGILDAATVRAAYERGRDDAASTTTTTTAPPDTTTPETPAPPPAPTTTAPPETTPPVTTAPPPTVPETTLPPTTLPPQPPVTGPTLLEMLTADGRFTKILGLFATANFDEDFEELQKYTVFAPTDDAIGDDELAELSALDPEALGSVLATYIYVGALPSANMVSGDLDGMMSGIEIPVVVDGDVITVGGATIVERDLPASNGYLHVLDALFNLT